MAVTPEGDGGRCLLRLPLLGARARVRRKSASCTHIDIDTSPHRGMYVCVCGQGSEETKGAASGKRGAEQTGTTEHVRFTSPFFQPTAIESSVDYQLAPDVACSKEVMRLAPELRSISGE